MKTIFHDVYGGPDVLKFKDVDKPVPGDDEVLVRVRAAGVNPYDWRFMRGSPYFIRLFVGLSRPATKNTLLGADVAGEVESVGRSVRWYRPGDAIFGQVTLGSFAEYVRVPEDRLARKPDNLTFEQAAAVPMAALTALQALRDQGGIQPGQRVLINGAAGGIGTFAVQLAKVFGAEVTGVCSTGNVDLVRSIGADHVVDYCHEDFTRGDRRYDLMVDNVGNRKLSDCRRVLAAKATYIAVGAGAGRALGPLIQVLGAVALSPFVSQRLTRVIERANVADLLVMKGLLETGKVTPVIDRAYPLDKVAEAIGYVETGHARGKVVITL
jgi:NADPH:quinone reductase-like Zn-dependent oxidoreductase